MPDVGLLTISGEALWCAELKKRTKERGGAWTCAWSIGTGRALPWSLWELRIPVDMVLHRLHNAFLRLPLSEQQKARAT